MTAWREQWEEFKDNSAFYKLGEKSVLAYLKHCLSREILVAVNYKEKKHRKRASGRDSGIP